MTLRDIIRPKLLAASGEMMQCDVTTENSCPRGLHSDSCVNCEADIILKHIGPVLDCFVLHEANGIVTAVPEKLGQLLAEYRKWKGE